MFTDIINKGLVVLKREQQLDGSFLSFSSPHPRTFNNALKFESVFSTALILSCINNLPESCLLQEIKLNAASFLLSQKSDYWSFNYWSRNSSEYKNMPYPDDLDDTACALAALYQFDKNLINGSALAKIVSLLTSVEIQEGGPYKTWLVPENVLDIWKDVDLAVNSNIAYFLSLNEISLPNLEKMVSEAIDKGNLKSPYYSSEYSLIYFIARFYKGKLISKLTERVLNNKDAHKYWGNTLNTALAVSSLLNLKVPSDLLKDSIYCLIKNQKNRLWKPYPFYIGVNPQKNRTHFSGSTALTTAFCLEAINKYSLDRTQTNKIEVEFPADQKKIISTISHLVDSRFNNFSSELRLSFDKIFRKISQTDKNIQIKLLPYFFRLSLGVRGQYISDDFVTQLGIANLYGWIAYTIYDDFLDDEGKAEMLPIANICLMELNKIFLSILPKNYGFTETFQLIMDKLEQANHWEVTNCRIKQYHKINFESLKIPDFKNNKVLADKSLGHCLGALAIFYALGLNDKSTDTKNLIKFFRYYLTARQLNDDAHDWEEDLKRGHINSVGAALLRRYRTKYANGVGAAVMVSELQKIFWLKMVRKICYEIIQNINKAKTALKKISIIEDKKILGSLLDKIENSATNTLWEQKKATDFLKSYSGGNT